MISVTTRDYAVYWIEVLRYGIIQPVSLSTKSKGGYCLVNMHVIPMQANLTDEFILCYDSAPNLARCGLYWNTERRNAGTPERRNAGTPERRNTKTRNTKLLKHKTMIT